MFIPDCPWGLGDPGIFGLDIAKNKPPQGNYCPGEAGLLPGVHDRGGMGVFIIVGQPYMFF